MNYFDLSGSRYCDKKAPGVWPMAGSDGRSGGVTPTLLACEEKCLQNDHCAWIGCDHSRSFRQSVRADSNTASVFQRFSSVQIVAVHALHCRILNIC